MTLAVCLAGYFWHTDDKVTEKVMTELIIGTIGITLTVACEIRVKLSEMEEGAHRVITQTEQAKKIVENNHKDGIFAQRHDEPRKEIDELAAGTYHLYPLSAVYKDDIRSIDSLRSISSPPARYRSPQKRLLSIIYMTGNILPRLRATKPPQNAVFLSQDFTF
jgi:hypothetical protein